MGTDATPKVRARWTDLATLGFLQVAAAMVLFFIAMFGWGLDKDSAGFFGVTLGVASIATILVRLFGTWSKAVGILLGLLIGFALWWSAFGVTRPMSFFDFMPALLILPGALIGIGSCIAAIVAKRRGHVGSAAGGNERRTIRIIVPILIVAAIASGISTFAGRSTVIDPGIVTRTTARMHSFKFDPTRYSVQGGSKILAVNDDPFVHTFTVDALGIDVTIGPGSSKLIGFPARTGTFVLYCKLHTDNKEAPTKDDMAATLTVT